MSLRPTNTAFFEEMSQRWRVIGKIVSDLTGPRFEPQTCRSTDERVTARPTDRPLFNLISQCNNYNTLPRSNYTMLCNIKIVLSEFVNKPQNCYLFYCMNPAGKASRLCEQKQTNSAKIFYTDQYSNQRWSRGHKARGQGQGQPFRGHTLSRPRTEMPETKDQGHSRKCFQKKKKRS